MDLGDLRKALVSLRKAVNSKQKENDNDLIS